MRTAAVILPFFLLAACNVDQDGNAVTVQYDQNTAEQAVQDAGNIGGAIVNDVEQTADKVGDRIDNTDVDVDVDTNTANNR